MVFALQRVSQTSFVISWQPILYGRWWWRLAPSWWENMERGKYQQKPSWKSAAGKARWNIPGSREQQARLLCLLCCVRTLNANDAFEAPTLSKGYMHTCTCVDPIGSFCLEADNKSWGHSYCSSIFYTAQTCAARTDEAHWKQGKVEHGVTHLSTDTKSCLTPASLSNTWEFGLNLGCYHFPTTEDYRRNPM